jgi:hypothetical protein
MFVRDFDTLEGRSNRDTVEGFASIAVGLDRGIDVIGNGNKMADIMAIGLGWLLLSAIIFYPSLHVAAFAICIAFMSIRTFAYNVLGIDNRRFSKPSTLPCR